MPNTLLERAKNYVTRKTMSEPGRWPWVQFVTIYLDGYRQAQRDMRKKGSPPAKARKKGKG